MTVALGRFMGSQMWFDGVWVWVGRF